MSSMTQLKRVHDLQGPPMPSVMVEAGELIPAPIYDLSRIDLTKTVVSLEDIQQVIPQRHEMEQLHGVVHIDDAADVIIGRRNVNVDEFWVKTMPHEYCAMPGTLLLEYAAQLAAYWGMVRQPHMGFVGFAKCDKLQVYGKVRAPSVVYMLSKVISMKPRRVIADCQAICEGRVVFGVTVTGMSV